MFWRTMLPLSPEWSEQHHNPEDLDLNLHCHRPWLWNFQGRIWTRNFSGVLIIVIYGSGIEFALRCDPGEVFMRDCNICICSVDGIADHASCTIHQCRRSKRGMIEISKWYRSGKNMLLNKTCGTAQSF
jgi:hypothetical protein